MTTIIELLGMRPVSVYASKHGTDDSVPLPNQLVGVELEIEQFPVPPDGLDFGGVAFTADHSLRNNGIEVITKPIFVKHLAGLLKAFFGKYPITEANYTDRTSTHVHFNVQPLTVDQISTICLVYQTVESLLFRWVGNERENNIYCVPWNQCNLNFDVVSRLGLGGPIAHDTFRRWQKYAALNLIPVAEQGTMEFRHLHGTSDIATIMKWVSIISQMFKYAQKVSLPEAKQQILNMNTVSNYSAWMFDVFGDHASDLQYYNYERELSIGVVDSKLMLMNDGKGVPQGYAGMPMIFDDHQPRDEEEDMEEREDWFHAEDRDHAMPPPQPRMVNIPAAIYGQQINIARGVNYNWVVQGQNEAPAPGPNELAAVPQPVLRVRRPR